MVEYYKRDVEVSDDHILLSEILDEYEVTVKRLAMLTGRAASTIYKYASGDATIPSVIWRVLYKLTGDTRITELITGDVGVMVVKLLADGEIECAATIKRLLATRCEQIKCEKIILDILADGKIDYTDRADIQRYKKAFPAMITAQSQIYEAITGKFDRKGVRNGSKRTKT